jgi:hypothetical protein
MATKEYTITIRTDFDSEEADNIFLGSVKQGARHMQATALLMPARRQVQIALEGSDFFTKGDEISLLEDILADDYHGGNNDGKSEG